MIPLTIKGKYVFLFVFFIFYKLKSIGISIGSWSPYNDIIDLIAYCVIMGNLYLLIDVDDIVISYHTSTETKKN
ncbi:unnamed protein product [Cunninghamella echinulata]